MSQIRTGCRTGLVLLACAACGWLPARAEITDTHVTIGEEWAVVRELRRLAVMPGEHDLWLEDIPLEADLSTLTLRTRRIPVDVLEWERVDAADRHRASNSPSSTRLGIRPGGHVEEMGVQASQPSEDNRSVGVVRCRVRMPVGGTQVFEVTYQMRGLTWSVSYQALLRGEPDSMEEQVPLDLVGVLHFQNKTGRAFRDASVFLIGADPRLLRAPQRLPGFLVLADTPLADLWREQASPHRPEFTYRLPRRVDMPAYGASESHFISATRIAASRLYVMDATAVHLTLTGVLQPLPQYLVFLNTTESGLGWILPPGPVEVMHGATRRAMLQRGFLPHTMINHEIRIELGTSAEVMGSRRSIGQMPEVDGVYEERYALVVENRRAGVSPVEIIERPPIGLGWTVERVSEDHAVEQRRILMHPRLGPRETRRIEYRLLVQQPTM